MTSSNPTWIIVCDFDGTVTSRDLGGELARAYVAATPDSAHQRFKRGEISLFELQRQIWPQVKADQAMVEAFMDNVAELRSGFQEFCNFCAHHGLAFHLVSGGFDFYIPYVLAKLGVTLPVAATIQCNLGTPSQQGIAVTFPHRHPSCENCSICKGLAIQKLRQRYPGATVVGIGDGASDHCMALEADILFARSHLLDYCRDQQRPHVAYEDFFTVMEALLSEISWRRSLVSE